MFPVIAFSPAGWVKEAACISSFVDASPFDDLKDWIGLEIYDSTGKKFTATRVWRVWPSSHSMLWICKLANISMLLDFDLGDGQIVPLQELIDRIKSQLGDSGGIQDVTSFQEAINLCL